MITYFKDQYRFLSNFYPSPINMKLHDEYILFPTVEHYYQAMKVATPEAISEILKLKTPGETKRWGRTCDLREDWEFIKNEIMMEALEVKFRKNSKLSHLLLKTNNEILIEGNTWHDNYWGKCFCSKCKNKLYKNTLGKMLMYVRKNLREKDK